MQWQKSHSVKRPLAEWCSFHQQLHFLWCPSGHMIRTTFTPEEKQVDKTWAQKRFKLKKKFYFSKIKLEFWFHLSTYKVSLIWKHMIDIDIISFYFRWAHSNCQTCCRLISRSEKAAAVCVIHVSCRCCEDHAAASCKSRSDHEECGASGRLTFKHVVCFREVQECASLCQRRTDVSSSGFLPDYAKALSFLRKNWGCGGVGWGRFGCFRMPARVHTSPAPVGRTKLQHVALSCPRITSNEVKL